VEAAMILSITPDAVRSRLRRGRRKIVTSIEKLKALIDIAES
jgi:DNA-directed RNA polymerase specialized sigma24 family protein